MFGKTGNKNSRAKVANIYRHDTDELIAEHINISEWCKDNGYDRSSLSHTARADRSKPHHYNKNRHQQKGMYARHVD